MPPPPAASVTLAEDDQVLIKNLLAGGNLAALAEHAVAEGRDLEPVVRAALEVGAAVLLHGGAKGTVDAVAAEVDRVLSALRGQTEALDLTRRTRNKIASRGLSFEADLGSALDACFAPYQDVLEDTGTSKGIGEAKVGDFVLTINPRDTGGKHRRIVFEAKDRSLTSAKALAELDQAMENRGATVGVLVFANPAQAPMSSKSLRWFPGNRLIVIWDHENGGDLALEIAAQFARTLAISAEASDGKLNRRGFADRFDKLISISTAPAASSAASATPASASKRSKRPMRRCATKRSESFTSCRTAFSQQAGRHRCPQDGSGLEEHRNGKSR
jgi:hypothetical protein